MDIFIYGLFEGDRLRYVGQTRQPKDRVNSQRRKHPALEFSVLTRCDWAVRNTVEREFITMGRAAGGCDLNMHDHQPRGAVASERARRAQANRKANLAAATIS